MCLLKDKVQGISVSFGYHNGLNFAYNSTNAPLLFEVKTLLLKIEEEPRSMAMIAASSNGSAAEQADSTIGR
jgi:hypothetical protein